MDESESLASLEEATRRAGIPESNPSEALPRGSVSEPPDTFWKVIWGIFSDSKRTDNVVRLAVFACVLLISLTAATVGTIAVSRSDEKDKSLGTTVLITVVTGIYGLAAGAGLR